MSKGAALGTCEMGTAVTVKLMARCISLDTKNCAKCTTTPGIIDTGTFQFVCPHVSYQGLPLQGNICSDVRPWHGHKREELTSHTGSKCSQVMTCKAGAQLLSAIMKKAVPLPQRLKNFQNMQMHNCALTRKGASLNKSKKQPLNQVPIC
jgi:hypothetical protein